ncbi:hypothetical protein HC762_00375 [bacterium]|nr:hypothetical protein [bacterium]
MARVEAVSDHQATSLPQHQQSTASVEASRPSTEMSRSRSGSAQSTTNSNANNYTTTILASLASLQLDVSQALRTEQQGGRE